MSISAGTAYIDVVPNMAAFGASVQKGVATAAAPAAKGFTTAFAGLKKSLTGLFVGALAIGGLDMLINKTIEYQRTVEAISASFGIDSQAAAKFNAVAEDVGVSASSLSTPLIKLTKSAADATKGVGLAMTQWGIDVSAFLAADPSQKILLLANAYQAAGSRQSEFIAQVLGPRGKMMAPALAEWALAMKAVGDEHFPVPSKEEVIRMADFQRRLSLMAVAVGGVVLRFLERFRVELLAVGAVFVTYKLTTVVIAFTHALQGLALTGAGLTAGAVGLFARLASIGSVLAKLPMAAEAGAAGVVELGIAMTGTNTSSAGFNKALTDLYGTGQNMNSLITRLAANTRAYQSYVDDGTASSYGAERAAGAVEDSMKALNLALKNNGSSFRVTYADALALAHGETVAGLSIDRTSQYMKEQGKAAVHFAGMGTKAFNKWRRQVVSDMTDAFNTLGGVDLTVKSLAHDFQKSFNTMIKSTRIYEKAMRTLSNEKFVPQSLIEFLQTQGPEAVVGFTRLSRAQQDADIAKWKAHGQDINALKPILDSLASRVKSTTSIADATVVGLHNKLLALQGTYNVNIAVHTTGTSNLSAPRPGGWDNNPATPWPTAEGAVVMPRRGGTVVRVAEAGRPEAIIPLSKTGVDRGGPMSGEIEIRNGRMFIKNLQRELDWNARQ
jgi:hypothetical protein